MGVKGEERKGKLINYKVDLNKETAAWGGGGGGGGDS